ncbi:MAG: aldo/keto reductase [Candidatus Hydrogenedentes bacterium]|nr:aldo/keto reductase [Candidatus Hydrogenedentota bacterium]
MTSPSPMNRRTFLQTTAATGLIAAGALNAPAAPAPPVYSRAGNLPWRTFGKTGVELPILAYGSAPLMTWEDDYYGISSGAYEARVKMVRLGYEKGLRYFDTARIYGESEQIFAEALRDVYPDIFLASKVLVKSVEELQKSVDDSMSTLKTDRIDCMQLHGPTIERLGYDGCMPLVEALVKMRDEGRFTFIGLTGHSRFEEMYKLIDTGIFDTLLIEFGYFHKGYNTRHSNRSLANRDLCVARASELNMGILGMKVMGASIFGHNAAKLVPEFGADAAKKLPPAAIRWVLNDSRIHLLNIGISVPEDLDANIATLTGDTALTNEDRMLLASFAEKAYEQPAVQELREV